MYRVIKFNKGKGKTLGRFNTQEELTAYHNSNPDESGSSGGDTTKKHCIVEFQRGTDDCTMLAQFDNPQEAQKYYETVKNKHEPFGPYLVLDLELQPNGGYDDLLRKPHYRQTWSQKK